MRLIELDAALEGLENLNAISFYEANEHSKEAYMETKGMLKTLPTVDAVPVVHGHWKEDTGGYGFWLCSHCGFVSEASAADLLYRYCPQCGARMDGKDGDHAEGTIQKERS